jgi:hypothetical protein
MYISDVNIKDILTYNNISNFIKNISLISLFFLMVTLLICIGSYYNLIQDYKHRVKTIKNIEYVNKEILCRIIDCTSYITLVRDDNSNKKTMFYVEKYIKNDKDIAYFYVNEQYITDINIKYFNMFNKDFKPILKIKDTVYIMKIDGFLNSFLFLISKIFIFYLLLFSTCYLLKLIRKHKIIIFKEDRYKSDLESRLKIDIAESASHEMSTPVALITTIITDLYSNLYPCKYTESGVCDFNKEEISNDICKECPIENTKKRSIDIIAIDHYKTLKFALDRLNSVLALISTSKHIKYNNGSVSILDIINNCVNVTNDFKNICC